MSTFRYMTALTSAYCGLADISIAPGVCPQLTWFMAVPLHLATKPSNASCNGICSAGMGPFVTGFIGSG